MGRCAYGETGVRGVDGDGRVCGGVTPDKEGCHPCKALQASYTVTIVICITQHAAILIGTIA